MEFKQHPLSAAFPAMLDADLDALAQDVATRGLLEPGIVLEGMVLDGWHRYRACKKAGVKFATQPFSGKDPVGFVLARNLHRRHLTASQRAAAIVAATNWKPAGRPEKNPAPGAGFPDLSLSDKQLAATAEVSERTIRHAKAAERAGLGDAVKDGKVSAKQAAEIAKLPEKKRGPAVEAARRGEAPKKSQKPHEPAHEERLEMKLAELQEALSEATDEITRLSTRTGDVDSETLIKNLQAELRAVKAKRDDLMRENAELRKQVKFLQRKAA